MNISEKLRNLKIDPLYKSGCLPSNIAYQFSCDNRIKLYFSEKIKSIWKSYYEPLGIWCQNPKTDSGITDFGIVINNEWSKMNYGDTNYYGWIYYFDITNKLLVDLGRKLNLTKITLYKEEYDIENLQTFDENWIFNIEKTKSKIRKQLILLYHFKEEILSLDSVYFNTLIRMFTKTSSIGIDAEDYYEKHLSKFFDDLTSYKKTSGTGDYEDRVRGIDFWHYHKDKTTTANVKNVYEILDEDNNYIIKTSLTKNSNCDYVVTVNMEQKRIIVFNNDKSKININIDSRGVVFPKETIYKEIVINE